MGMVKGTANAALALVLLPMASPSKAFDSHGKPHDYIGRSSGLWARLVKPPIERRFPVSLQKKPVRRIALFVPNYRCGAAPASDRIPS